MCLTIKSGPYVAKKDFRVYKVLWKKEEGLCSPYFDEQVWEPGVVQPYVELERDGNHIGSGYHAYISFKVLKFEVRDCNKIFKGLYQGFRMVIPKGAEFYIGYDHEIVSSQMMLVDGKPV